AADEDGDLRKSRRQEHRLGEVCGGVGGLRDAHQIADGVVREEELGEHERPGRRRVDGAVVAAVEEDARPEHEISGEESESESDESRESAGVSGVRVGAALRRLRATWRWKAPDPHPNAAPLHGPCRWLVDCYSRERRVS